ncbi:hypothetical protein D9758_011430 [Tetrapyrgos nigripes]|uniref:Terpenoid synthase n=1 Tax=Tetrapyrgos nigripes TaxID=182062 RepID=A0A8H5FRB8_9AGAR|nr:hypothetical protein D9758_011430 [Tetrapyrgos nigripes]
MAPFPSEIIQPTKIDHPGFAPLSHPNPFVDNNSPSSSSTSESLDSSYFIPLRIHTCEPSAGDIISNAIRYTIECCSTPNSNARKAALKRHTNPSGNLYAMMFSSSEKDRLCVAVMLVEFLCILDDVMEELAYEQAIREHEILCQALKTPSCDGLRELQELETTDVICEEANVHCEARSDCLDGMKKFLIEIRESILSLSGGRQCEILLTGLETTLRLRECAPATFATLREYIPYRLINLDLDFVCLLLRWSMNFSTSIDLPSFSSSFAVDLGVEDHGLYSTLTSFQLKIGVIAGLGNDYYSWDREKKHYSGCSDRLMNAVPVLMREHSIEEDEAKEVLKEVIVDQASSVEELMEQLGVGGGDGKREEPIYGRMQKPELRRYLEALEYLAGGYVYWCSTCPRYRII